MGKRKQIQLNPGWAIYLRTSTEENQAPERSQESQRRVIHNQLVAGSDLPIIHEYSDTYSGRKTDRQNYQRLLADARLGKFSHVAVYTIDRFGRNDVECGRAFDELAELNIQVKIASYPGLDLSNAAGRMIVGLMSSVARFESDRNSERTIEGMLTKLLEGGWPFRAPDGYLNREERAGAGDRKNSRYRRWVEIDPEQSKVWRFAWDLLLSDEYSLAEICERLYAHGLTRADGTPFVTFSKAGRRQPQVNVLSRVFHNWFYAGWVVVDNKWAKVPPKEIRGTWEPIVTTEEFERGLRILAQRNKHRNQQKRNFYLLQGKIYLLEESGVETRLICSTSNSSRSGGGTAYYCVRSSNLNFQCKVIDAQLEQMMHAIQIDSECVPALREAYLADLDYYMRFKKRDDRAELQAKLKELQEYEKSIARKNAKGILSDEAYQALWLEFNEQTNQIRATLDDMEGQKAAHIENLDDALNLLTELGILYGRLDQQARKRVLKHLVRRVVINPEGMIVRLDLRTPFTYLCKLAFKNGFLNGEGAAHSSTGINNASNSSLACSTSCTLGVPNQDSFDQPFSSETSEILFFDKIAYPHRSRIERFLSANAS